MSVWRCGGFRLFLSTAVWSPILTCSLLQLLMGAAQLVIQGVAAHRSHIVELVSSASAALELELYVIIYTLRLAKRVTTVSGPDPDASARRRAPWLFDFSS